MEIIGWIIVAGMGAWLFGFVVVEFFGGTAKPSGSSPKRQQAQLAHRVQNGHSEISDVFAAAREKMNRRAGLDNSFRLRSDSRNRW